ASTAQNVFVNGNVNASFSRAVPATTTTTSSVHQFGKASFSNQTAKISTKRKAFFDDFDLSDINASSVAALANSSFGLTSNLFTKLNNTSHNQSNTKAADKPPCIAQKPTATAIDFDLSDVDFEEDILSAVENKPS